MRRKLQEDRAAWGPTCGASSDRMTRHGSRTGSDGLRREG